MRKQLHLEIPIVQGGMGVGVSLGILAGTVASFGGAGTISTAQIGFREPDFENNPLAANLRAMGTELKKAREIANGRGMIGFNIMTVTKHYEAYVKEAVRLEVDFIASGAGLPMELPSLTKGSGVLCIPIVSSKKAANVICKRWMKREGVLPDGIIMEGPKAGGHLGFSKEEAIASTQDSGMEESYEAEVKDTIAWVRELGEQNKKYIPFIAAGGIDTKEEVQKYLAFGADAVQVSTRFITTKECDAHSKFKEAYVKCEKEDIVIVKSPVGMPGRGINNAFVKETQQHAIPPKKCYQCISICKPLQTPYCITHALICAVTGDTEHGLIFCGANAWKENQIRTVKEVLADLLPTSK